MVKVDSFDATVIADTATSETRNTVFLIISAQPFSVQSALSQNRGNTTCWVKRAYEY